MPMPSFIKNSHYCLFGQVQTMGKLTGYNAKQRLQFLVFPQGVRYNKETDECRTEEENEFSLRIPQLSKSYNGSEKKQRGTPYDVAPLVAHRGIEPLFEE